MIYIFQTNTKLVGEGQSAHTTLDAEDVVVGGEHVHGGGTEHGGLHSDSNLRVIDAGEVASAGRLVLLGLERERVRVHTGRGVTGVMVEGLHLVEVLALLLLEAVLAVKHKLEGGQGTGSLLGVLLGGNTGGVEGGTNSRHGDEAVGKVGRVERVGLENDIVGGVLGGEVPHLGTSGGVGEAPHKLLDGVVVGEANLLGLAVGDGVRTSVLHLLNEVLVALLRKTTTLLSVEVHVVGPDLEHGGVEVGTEGGREVNVHPDLVVLQCNQWKVKPRVAVEEENEGKVDGTGGGGGHLGVSRLLRLVEVQLGVQTPPLLVVLVDALATDGKLNVVDRTLGDPVAVVGGVGGNSVRGEGEKLDVHVTNQITVTGDGDGHAAGVGGSTVHGLLDVLHGEVSVALVLGLVKSDLRVTGKVDILGTVRDELHETASHFESCCTIHREKNFS